MAFGSIHGLLDGITGTIGRSVAGYLMIAVSTTLAFVFIEGFEPILLGTWPFALLFAALAWHYLIFISLPLFLTLVGFFYQSLRDGFDRRSTFALVAVPYLLVSGPFWYDEGIDKRSLCSLALLCVFCWLYWKPPGFLNRSDSPEN